MKLVKLNTTLIQRTQQPDHTNPNFNTSFHPESAAPDLIRASEAPYTFKRWLPLILRTRQNTASPSSPSPSPTSTPAPTPTTPAEAASVPVPVPPVQTIPLTRTQTALLHATAEASLPRLEVNRLYREDLAEEIYPLLESGLIFPPEGLFLRLDACSPKDGVGPVALRGVGDVVSKVVTSVRARNALGNWLEGGSSSSRSATSSSGGGGGEGGGGEGGGQKGMELFFLPFDARMAADREYRVFCAPGDGRIAGVSQYRWYRAWRFQSSSERAQERVVRAVLAGAEEVRG